MTLNFNTGSGIKEITVNTSYEIKRTCNDLMWDNKLLKRP